ncbi:G-protein coupled receptor moody-like [Leptidea sinapis]|uniref:G-protein coupled receptor moody-like n=1 Tax=Leptidea sinapis TaxID=189913 RepID=UPI0021C45F2B|nr:G-protein coupled receptor moody-like [Leptidea sinapis]
MAQSDHAYVNLSAENPFETDLGALQLFKDYPDGLLGFAFACCILFMLVGIPGNLITIIALARYEKIRNATAIFIISLSFSDLLLCCFNLPLSASTFIHRSWVHGRFLCRLFPLMRYALVATSLFTVMAITMNRYVIIAHPRLYPRMYKQGNITLMLAAIWLASFGVLIATWFDKWGRFGLDVDIGSCSIILDKNGRSPKKILFMTAFLLPSISILVCYTRIFFIVRKTTKNSGNSKKTGIHNAIASISSVDSSDGLSSVKVSGRESSRDNIDSQYDDDDFSRNKNTTFQIQTKEDKLTVNQAIKHQPSRLRRTALRKSMALLKLSLPTRKDKRLGTMIIAIIISFCMCHLPITITKMAREITPLPALNIASYLLLYLSSCINPVIYVAMSKETRKAYMHLFKSRRK